MTDPNGDPNVPEDGRGQSQSQQQAPQSQAPQYTENPNGYGANYVNQPQPGQQTGAAAQGQAGDNQNQTAPQYGQPYAYTPSGAQGQYGAQNPYGAQYPYGAQGQPGPQNPYAAQNPYAQPGGFDPFRLIESMLPQRARNWIRGTYAVVGVTALIIGIALLVWPGPTLVVATVALGIYFLVSGIVRAVTALAAQGLPSGWRVLDVLVGVLLTVGGIVVLKNAMMSASALLVLITCMVGIGWIMEGFMGIVESWRVPSSGWAVAYGVVSIIAGIIVLVTPMESTVFLVIFAGCALVVMGVTALVRAFTFGRAPRAPKR